MIINVDTCHACFSWFYLSQVQRSRSQVRVHHHKRNKYQLSCEKFHQVDTKTILITLIQPKTTYCLPVEPRMGQVFTYWWPTPEVSPDEGFRREAETSIKQYVVFGCIRVINTSISCHRQTRATRCITTNELQTKVDAQCDKLATERSWQRLRRSSFSSYSTSFVESRQF